VIVIELKPLMAIDVAIERNLGSSQRSVVLAFLAFGQEPLEMRLVFDPAAVQTVDVRLPHSFRATGKHFVSVQLVVEGYQSKDGSHRANGRDLTLPDGTKLFLGSSGTGAPYEVQRPGVDTEEK